MKDPRDIVGWRVKCALVPDAIYWYAHTRTSWFGWVAQPIDGYRKAYLFATKKAAIECRRDLAVKFGQENVSVVRVWRHGGRRPPRRYLTHDCDQARVELIVEAGGNGDWYISIVREGQLFNRLAPKPGERGQPPPATVRITTSGERRQHKGVAAAVADLWRALGGCGGNDDGEQE